MLHKCCACAREIYSGQPMDYLGDKVRHMHRSDCIYPMDSEISLLRSLLERARPMVAAEAALSRHYGSADETDTAVALLADIEEALKP